MTIEKLITIYQKTDNERLKNLIFKRVWEKNEGIVYANFKQRVTDKRFNHDDYIGVAQACVLETMDKFEASQGFKFSTYLASRIHFAATTTNKLYYTIRPLVRYVDDKQVAFNPTMKSMNNTNKDGNEWVNMFTVDPVTKKDRMGLKLARYIKDRRKREIFIDYYEHGRSMPNLESKYNLTCERIRQLKRDAEKEVRKVTNMEREKWLG